jgi:hypothetical protein
MTYFCCAQANSPVKFNPKRNGGESSVVVTEQVVSEREEETEELPPKEVCKPRKGCGFLSSFQKRMKMALIVGFWLMMVVTLSP